MLNDGGSKMQYKEVAGGICAPKGFAAAGVHCGIRANHSEKYDLALIKAEVRCAAAGVYTTNKVCGAPIKVDRAHLKDGYAQAILVNSGNANTCAANGVALAEECCALVGKALNMDEKDVLPASTGVIGQPMVIDPFARGIPAAEEAAREWNVVMQLLDEMARLLGSQGITVPEYEDLFSLLLRSSDLGHIPQTLDAVVLDIDYMERYKDFTVDEERFPHFADFTAGLCICAGACGGGIPLHSRRKRPADPRRPRPADGKTDRSAGLF